MESEIVRQRGERAHRIGVAVNGLLAVLKIVGGLVSGSTALFADGCHSLADLATGGVAWFSFRVAARPPDEDHHYGHGKAEAAAGVFVGAVLGVAGAGVFWDALASSGPEYPGATAAVALGVALVSILANEWLVRVTGRAANELSSQALRALERDNRSDSLSSGLVIVGIAGGLAGLSWAEPVMTALIGVFIVVMGLRSLREGLDVLMDRVADAELRERMRAAALQVAGVEGVQRIRIHPLGSIHRADMEISVDGELSVRKGHEIAHEVESAVTRAEAGVVQVSVHVNPAS